MTSATTPPDNDAPRTAVGRRGFLGGVGAVAAAGALAAACTRELAIDPASRSLARIRENGGGWDDVRALFPLSSDWNEMSAMLITSHPKPVADAIARHRDAIDAEPGVYVQSNSKRLNGVSRAAVGRYLAVDPEGVAMTDSTTQSVALVLQGLKLKPGQEVLTTDKDYFVTHESLRLKTAMTGATERRIKLYDDVADVSEEALVDAVMRQVRPSTRALALTWVHSSTGLKIPAPAIAAAVARVNAGRDDDDRLLFCLDSVHGFGNQDLDFAAIGCDFLMAGCHKWMFGPRGTGVIVGREDAWPQLTPLFPSFADDGAYGRWMRNEPALPTSAAMVSPGGFKAFEHYFALGEAFDLHRAVGRKRIADRTAELAAQLKDGLAAMPGVTLKTPRDRALSAGIVSFDLDGQSPWTVVERLREKKIVASVAPYRTPHVRLTPSVRNTPDEIEAALREVRGVAAAV